MKNEKLKKLILLMAFFHLFNIAWAQEENEQIDRYAKIGNKAQALRMHLLEEKIPVPLPEKYLPVEHDRNAVFAPIKKMNTSEDLYQELEKMRKEYEPFMADYAPEMEIIHNRIELKKFLWREETDNDRKDFRNVLNGKGEWKEVTIPHFGPPIGRAVTYYFKRFSIDRNMLDHGSLFACFKGVDYKADLFVNGYYIGSHEGFFAPFEFEISRNVNEGDNFLVVKVGNDFTTTGGKDKNGNHVVGNKIYAASGLGYDDPETGWHHCPPGMGISQDCYIEARDPLHINDVFIRPLPEKEKAEVWLEVNNFSENLKDIRLELSVYGQNFKDTIFESQEYIPRTTYIPGVGDLAKPADWEERRLKMGHGVNFLKTSVHIEDPRLWCNKTPWLYQLQIRLYDEEGKLTDTYATQFGMRSFAMDTLNVPKGMMYLNGKKIRLRGANTMGFLQQDVFKKEMEQLRDDILLAKICNMNFLRFTQRPVQAEIYEYCDKLGLMTQTDLPLFGGLRTNQWAECVKQAEEMERLVRNHPCNIMVTYINERFPNAEGSPQRCMSTAKAYYRLFAACDQAVLMANPDRVIKAGDGDYDPPSPGLPDNHCYNAWYNGHGLGLGKLHKGYWQWVKPGWYYACGEFGAEGLDPENVMRKYYPQEWLPQNTKEEENWNPGQIAACQTNRFHYMWFNTQYSVKDWIEASQEHQAWATRLITEAFRRDSNMVSFAIHLFIDAWPAGWMKTIMDVDRQPKKAFFVYRDALEPLMVNLRTDRYHFFSGEKIDIEAWLCNDLNTIPQGYKIKYQFEKMGKVIFAHGVDAQIPVNSSTFQGYINFEAPDVKTRTGYQLRLALFDKTGNGLSHSVIDLDVFPFSKPVNGAFYFSPSEQGTAKAIAGELSLKLSEDFDNANAVLIDDYSWYEANRENVNRLVAAGKTVVFVELPPGEYRIGETKVGVERTKMGSYYFVSPSLSNSLVNWAKPMDFKFWYNQSKDYVTPFLPAVFIAPEWTPVLISGNSDWLGDKGQTLAAAELKYGKGCYRICQVQLNNRLKTNPSAKRFAMRMIGMSDSGK